MVGRTSLRRTKLRLAGSSTCFFPRPSSPLPASALSWTGHTGVIFMRELKGPEDYGGARPRAEILAIVNYLDDNGTYLDLSEASRS